MDNHNVVFRRLHDDDLSTFDRKLARFRPITLEFTTLECEIWGLLRRNEGRNNCLKICQMTASVLARTFVWKAVLTKIKFQVQLFQHNY